MSNLTTMDYHAVTHAQVNWRNEVVGDLIKQSSRRFTFAYRHDYLTRADALAIAAMFPLRREEFVSESLHAYFDNLILEGWLLTQAEKLLHIAKSNRFAMLMATCRHTIGAVSITPLDAQGAPLPDLSTLHPSNLSLERHALGSPFSNSCPSCLLPSLHGSWHPKCHRDLWGTSKAVSIALDQVDPFASFSQTIHGGSISGAQRKGLFRFDHSSATLIPGAASSTHILKPSGDHPNLPENEHVTMAIARRLKFHVPPFALVNSTPQVGPAFVIKRFDRTPGGKLLKEDAAQLLGIASEDKYTGSNERVAAAIARGGSKLDLNEFLRRLVFCFVTGNGDMHLKNWALLENQSKNGGMQLSPCYDLLNTRLALPRESIDIGLPLLDKSRKLKGSYFRTFALDKLQLVPRYVESIFAELPAWQATIIDFVGRSALEQDSKERYLQIVDDRVSALTKQ